MTIKIEGINMPKYIFFDTETTGPNKEDRIIQVGAMIFDENDNVEIFDELCYSDVEMKIEAMITHGITPDDIKDKPSFQESKFYNRIKELNNPQNYIIAHNMPFDMGMLQKENFKPQLKTIDTLRVARDVLEDEESHALQYLRYSLKLYKEEKSAAQKYDIEIKAHDAIGDVLVMKLLFNRLYTLVKEKYPDVDPYEKMEEITITPKILELFPFGKYKGEKISDIIEKDRAYATWMCENVDHLDLKITLSKLLG